MELSALHWGLGLVIVGALALLWRASRRGGRMLGAFWDAEQRRIRAIRDGEQP